MRRFERATVWKNNQNNGSTLAETEAYEGKPRINWITDFVPSLKRENALQ